MSLENVTGRRSSDQRAKPIVSPWKQMMKERAKRKRAKLREKARQAEIARMPLPLCEDCGQICSHPFHRFCVECQSEKDNCYLPTLEQIAEEAAAIRAERPEGWETYDYVRNEDDEECEAEEGSESSTERSDTDSDVTQSLPDTGSQEVHGTSAGDNPSS